jgi:hypothetical protein
MAALEQCIGAMAIAGRLTDRHCRLAARKAGRSMTAVCVMAEAEAEAEAEEEAELAI